MSAIHGIDDMWAMEAGKFFRFCRRLPAYQGAIRAYVERQVRADERRKEQQGLAGREIVPVPAGELHKVPGLAAAGLDGLIQFDIAD